MNTEHKQRVISDLRAADILLARYLGPLHVIRRELAEYLKRVESQ